MRRSAEIVAAFALSWSLWTSPAVAGVAETMDSELEAAGVPGVSVTVTTPSAASPADLAALAANENAPAPTVKPENLISPNPTAPLPIATVNFGTTVQTPLAGLIAFPGGSALTVQDAESTIWRAEVMVALRRALGDGANLAGVAMREVSESSPDMYLTPPDPSYAPAIKMTGVTSVEAVRSEVQQSLPAWAQSATVTVNEVAGERRIKVELAVDPVQLISPDHQDLVPMLLDRQLRLNQSGGGVGGVSVELIDAGTAEPLFVYAGDATFGQNFSWVSPRVAAWINRVPADSADDEVAKAVAETGSAVEGLTGPDRPALP